MSNSLLQHAAEIGVIDRANIGNFQIGGQVGLGANLINLDASTPQVFAPAVIIVTKTPSMWGAGSLMAKGFKSMVECFATSISGIDLEYSLNTHETPVGHDSQTRHTPLNSQRSAVSPSITVPELKGNVFWNLIRKWITDTRDPDTQAARLNWDSTAGAPSRNISSEYTASIAVIQFDPTMRPEDILEGYFVTEMLPLGTGAIGIERNIGQSSVPERSFSFTGIVQHSDKTREVCYEMAKLLRLDQVDFNKKAPVVTGMDESLSDTGLSNEVDESLIG